MSRRTQMEMEIVSIPDTTTRSNVEEITELNNSYSPKRQKLRREQQEKHRPRRGEEELEMSIGWICFISGFILIFPWFIGCLLPICSENRNDTWAFKWNLLAFIASSIAFISVYCYYD